MFTEIDVENWPRKATYEFFKDYDDPFFNFTANIDVTRFYDFSRVNNLSFALAALYYVMTAANEIREFRIRLFEGRQVEFDKIHATQTILNDDETFSFAYFAMLPDVFGFSAAGRAALEKYKKLKSFDVESDRVDLTIFRSFRGFRLPVSNMQAASTEHKRFRGSCSERSSTTARRREFRFRSKRTTQ